MFKSDRVGNIELLEQKIQNLESNVSTSKSGYWQKLSEICSKLSADQLNFITNNQNVITAKTKMMNAFSLYLFEKYKDDFAEIQDFQTLCDDYIDTIEDTLKEYSDKVTSTFEENKALKDKINELERKLNNNEKYNSKRA